MTKNRMEAFSDGVLAIIITIMVLEMKIPHGHDLDALRPLIPVLLSYLMSFIYLGIYWNNHHHMLQTVKTVSGSILWANLHLLFWLSLIPFATGWMGENGFAPMPMALYGTVLLFAGFAYWLLQNIILHNHGPESVLHKAVGGDVKGKISLVLYLISIPLAFVNQWISVAIFIAVALMWLIPDRRIEKAMKDE